MINVSSATDQPVSVSPITAGERLNSQDLTVLAYSNGFTAWHYRTPSAAFLAPGYFEPVRELLREGDEIIVSVTGAEGARRARGFVHRFESDLKPTVEWEYVSPSLAAEGR